MVIVRPDASRGTGGSEGELFVAFNPGTCGVQKVWRGGMLFRGKVWDFSQDNCASADGARVYSEAASTLVELGDSAGERGGWVLHGLSGPGKAGTEEGWLFARSDSSLTSPEFDAAGWRRVLIAFDETQRNGPFRVDVSSDGGATWDAQSFSSTTHGSSDEDWQFDFKLIEHPTARTRIRWTLGPGAADKRIRRVRVFGDTVPWKVIDGERTLEVTPVWRGYERHDGSTDGPACTLMFDLLLPDGRAVHVRQDIGSSGTGSVVEKYRATGLPARSTLVLALPTLVPGAARTVYRPDMTGPPLGSAAVVEISAGAAGSALFTVTTSRQEHP